MERTRTSRFLATISAAALAVVAVLLVASPVAADHVDPAIITAVDEDGRYLEQSAAGLDAAIARANADGIAFVWLDDDGDSDEAVALADDIVDDLAVLGSRYLTVVVLTDAGFAASSLSYDQAELDRALDASFDAFRAGAVGRGLDDFGEALLGSLDDATTATTSGGGASGSDGDSGGSEIGESGDGGGIGFGTIVLGIAIVGGGFLLLRSFSQRRKAKRQAEIDLQEDRAEIKEQLKNNADRVITLGDRVIASGDQELISTYEEASATYQDVSQSVDGAETAAEIDALDDRIDHAEWQFEVIEARLDGLPVPPSPEERPDGRDQDSQDRDQDGQQGAGRSMPPPPSPPPPGDDRSVITSPTTGRNYPRPGGTNRRRGGGLGGLGGVLGGILGNIVLGGGLGGTRSRRSQRRGGGGLGDVFGSGRSGGGGLGDIFGSGRRRSGRKSSTGGGLGGGVLRRGNSRRSRSSRRSSGGRSRTRRRRSRSRGGRNF